jgi:signal transduction histidine kinase
MDPKTKTDETGQRAAMVHLDRAWVESYGSGTFQEALYELSLQARLAVKAHQVAISYVPDGDFQVAIHTHSFSEKYEKYNTYDVMPTGEGIWGAVVKRRLAVRMTDEELHSHPQWKNFGDLRDDRGLEHPPMRGWLAVPILRQDGGLVGVLQASDKYEGEFTEDDLNEFTHVAKMIATTFELEYVNQQLQRRAEELEKRTAELDRANEALEQSNVELQQFAYIASHDLQSPLRAIAGFAQFLQQDYQGQLDEKADEDIERIVAGCKRMQTMINDLLRYSRVESRSRPFEPTDLNEVFDDMVVILASSIQDSGGEVTRGELPTVTGDRSQLSQLFQNLIGNGLKYHGDHPPCVNVSAENSGNEWTVAVHDNGIGIGAKHHERIFEIFRRLHTEDQYPGTGIGLAVCRRIINRHGGKIWLESEPGEGSTFYFSIPEPPGSES